MALGGRHDAGLPPLHVACELRGGLSAHLGRKRRGALPLHAGGVDSGIPPAGMGMGKKQKPIYLKVGDKIRLGIGGLSEQNQTVYAWSPAFIDG